MSDLVMDPKTIEELRRRIQCLQKISERKDARIETLQKSTEFYLNYYNQTRKKDPSIDTTQDKEISSPKSQSGELTSLTMKEG